METYVVSMGLDFIDVAAANLEAARIEFARNVWPAHGFWDGIVATYLTDSALANALNGKIISNLSNADYSPYLSTLTTSIAAPIVGVVWLPGPNGSHEILGVALNYSNNTPVQFPYGGASLTAKIIFWAKWRVTPMQLP